MTSLWDYRRKNISIKLNLGQIINILCTFDTQKRYEEGEKEEFWRMLTKVLSLMPQGEKVFLEADLNDHIKVEKKRVRQSM